MSIHFRFTQNIYNTNKKFLFLTTVSHGLVKCSIAFTRKLGAVHFMARWQAFANAVALDVANKHRSRCHDIIVYVFRCTVHDMHMLMPCLHFYSQFQDFTRLISSVLSPALSAVSPFLWIYERTRLRSKWIEKKKKTNEFMTNSYNQGR